MARAERRPTKVPSWRSIIAACTANSSLRFPRVSLEYFALRVKFVLICNDHRRPERNVNPLRWWRSDGHYVSFHRAARGFNIRDNEEYKLTSRAFDLIDKQQFRTSIRFETRQQQAYKQPGILKTYGVSKVLNSPITIRYHNFRNLVKRIIF